MADKSQGQGLYGIGEGIESGLLWLAAGIVLAAVLNNCSAVLAVNDCIPEDAAKAHRIACFDAVYGGG